MKKTICIFLFVVTLISLVGCSTSTNQTASSQTSSQTSLDLTTMSEEKSLNKIYDILKTPSNYKGQLVKVTGTLSVYLDEETDKTYFSCVVEDSSTEDAPSFEFVLKDNLSYPDDYPKPDTKITVEGTLDYYEEDGTIYCRLLDATMTANN